MFGFYGDQRFFASTECPSKCASTCDALPVALHGFDFTRVSCRTLQIHRDIFFEMSAADHGSVSELIAKSLSRSEKPVPITKLDGQRQHHWKVVILPTAWTAQYHKNRTEPLNCTEPHRTAWTAMNELYITSWTAPNVMNSTEPCELHWIAWTTQNLMKCIEPHEHFQSKSTKILCIHNFSHHISAFSTHIHTHFSQNFYFVKFFCCSLDRVLNLHKNPPNQAKSSNIFAHPHLKPTYFPFLATFTHTNLFRKQ